MITMWKQLWDAFTQPMGEDMDVTPIQTIIESFAKAFTTISTFVGNISGTVAPIIADIFSTISNTMEELRPTIESIIVALAPVVKTMVEQIATIAGVLAEPIKQILELTDSNGVPLLQSMVETIGKSIAAIMVELAPHLPKLMEAITTIVNALAPAIVKIVAAIEPYIDEIVDMFVNAAVRFTETIVKIFEQYIIPNMPEIMQAISDLLDFAINHLDDMVKDFLIILIKLSPVINDFQRIKDDLSTAFLNLIGLAADIIRPVVDGIADLLNWLNELPRVDITKGIGDFFNGLFNQTANSPTSSVRPFATGGIVTEPTRALIGEAGVPEAVVPLSAEGIEKFTSGLAPKYRNGVTPSVEVNIDTFGRVTRCVSSTKKSSFLISGRKTGHAQR